MTHPIGEIAAAAAVVLALGASTLLVLPRPKPAEPRETIVLDIQAPESRRVDPLNAKTDVERVEDLERQLAELAAEQKALSEHVNTVMQGVSRAKKREPAP
jgi:hypothetical protein